VGVLTPRAASKNAGAITGPTVAMQVPPVGVLTPRTASSGSEVTAGSTVAPSVVGILTPRSASNGFGGPTMVPSVASSLTPRGATVAPRLPAGVLTPRATDVPIQHDTRLSRNASAQRLVGAASPASPRPSILSRPSPVSSPIPSRDTSTKPPPSVNTATEPQDDLGLFSPVRSHSSNSRSSARHSRVPSSPTPWQEGKLETASTSRIVLALPLDHVSIANRLSAAVENEIGPGCLQLPGPLSLTNEDNTTAQPSTLVDKLRTTGSPLPRMPTRHQRGATSPDRRGQSSPSRARPAPTVFEKNALDVTRRGGSLSPDQSSMRSPSATTFRGEIRTPSASTFSHSPAGGGVRPTSPTRPLPLSRYISAHTPSRPFSAGGSPRRYRGGH
jgi:hypothetical protein